MHKWRQQTGRFEKTIMHASMNQRFAGSPGSRQLGSNPRLRSTLSSAYITVSNCSVICLKAPCSSSSCAKPRLFFRGGGLSVNEISLLFWNGRVRCMFLMCPDGSLTPWSHNQPRQIHPKQPARARPLQLRRSFCTSLCCNAQCAPENSVKSVYVVSAQHWRKEKKIEQLHSLRISFRSNGVMMKFTCFVHCSVHHARSKSCVSGNLVDGLVFNLHSHPRKGSLGVFDHLPKRRGPKWSYLPHKVCWSSSIYLCSVHFPIHTVFWSGLFVFSPVQVELCNSVCVAQGSSAQCCKRSEFHVFWMQSSSRSRKNGNHKTSSHSPDPSQS